MEVIIGLFAIYLGGAIVAYRKFEKIGIEKEEESMVIIFSMFSWLTVLALYVAKLIKENGIDNNDMEI